MARQGGPASAPAPSPSLGARTAAVEMLEFGSLTCGHCHRFHLDVLPAIKSRYVDTGRVRYRFEAFPTPPANLSVPLHVIADCAGARRYQVLDAYMAAQPLIFEAARTGQAQEIVFRLARESGGLTDAQISACLADQRRVDRIQAWMDRGAAMGVSATPSIFVDGRIIEPPLSGHTVETMSAALDAALARRRQPAAKARPRVPR